LDRAEQIVNRQTSLFDKKEKIRASFMPFPGRNYVEIPAIVFEDRQQIFSF